MHGKPVTTQRMQVIQTLLVDWDWCQFVHFVRSGRTNDLCCANCTCINPRIRWLRSNSVNTAMLIQRNNFVCRVLDQQHSAKLTSYVVFEPHLSPFLSDLPLTPVNPKASSQSRHCPCLSFLLLIVDRNPAVALDCTFESGHSTCDTCRLDPAS